MRRLLSDGDFISPDCDSQGGLDHADQRLLARTARWLLPVLPHHPPVHCRRVCHGSFRTSQTGPPRAEHLRLGSLVPEDEGLRLHVHGLRAAEGLRHHQLLDVHLLYRAHHRRQLPRGRQGLKGRESGGAGEGQGRQKRWRRGWKHRQWRKNRLNRSSEKDFWDLRQCLNTVINFGEWNLSSGLFSLSLHLPGVCHHSCHGNRRRPGIQYSSEHRYSVTVEICWRSAQFSGSTPMFDEKKSYFQCWTFLLPVNLSRVVCLMHLRSYQDSGMMQKDGKASVPPSNAPGWDQRGVTTSTPPLLPLMDENESPKNLRYFVTQVRLNLKVLISNGF